MLKPAAPPSIESLRAAYELTAFYRLGLAFDEMIVHEWIRAALAASAKLNPQISTLQASRRAA